jgi:hypothetical protein
LNGNPVKVPGTVACRQEDVRTWQSQYIFATCYREHAKEKVVNHGPMDGRLALLTCAEKGTILAFNLVMEKSKTIS